MIVRTLLVAAATAVAAPVVLPFPSHAQTTADPSVARAETFASPTDRFVQMASVASAFGIESSNIALVKSTSPEVRAFAERQLADLGVARARLDEQARLNGWPPIRTTMDAKHAEAVDLMREKSGAGFDAFYLAEQRKAYASAIALFEEYAAKGDDLRLRAYALGALPTLRAHATHLAGIGRY